MVRTIAIGALVVLAVGALADEHPDMMSSRSNPFVDDPVVEEGSDGLRRLVFPQDSAIPRFATDTEREFLAARTQQANSASLNRRLRQFVPNSCACQYDSYCCNNWDAFCQSCQDGFATQYGCPAGACGSGSTGSGGPSLDPPKGSIFTPGEFELNEGILLAYEGPTSWLNILAQMAAAVTTQGGVGGSNTGGIIHLAVASNQVNSATNRFQSYGVNMNNVVFNIHNADTIWIRDYGARFIYESGARALIDHQYNIFSRVNDNAQPADFANERGIKRYIIADSNSQLVHGGGNYHVDSSESLGFATDLIVNENPSKGESGVIQLWQDFQNVTTVITDAFPTNVDGTQHIDMWLISIGPRKLIISDHVDDPGTIQASICNGVANMYTAMGWDVFRTPAENSGSNGANGVHYTYTNAVIVNSIVLVPTFSFQGSWNNQARNVWQAALPSYTIIQIESQAIVTAAGVLHCICMHVPAYDFGSGRTAPLAVITSTFDEVVSSGEVCFIYDDDRFEVSSVTLSVEINGAEVFSTDISVGTFDYEFSSSVQSQIAANQDSAVIILCVEDEDSETDCFSLSSGVSESSPSPPPSPPPPPPSPPPPSPSPPPPSPSPPPPSPSPPPPSPSPPPPSPSPPPPNSPPPSPPNLECSFTTPTGDDILNITDVILTLGFIINGPSGQTSTPCFFLAADTNSDGVVDITDIIALTNVIIS